MKEGLRWSDMLSSSCSFTCIYARLQRGVMSFTTIKPQTVYYRRTNTTPAATAPEHTTKGREHSKIHLSLALISRCQVDSFILLVDTKHTRSCNTESLWRH